MGCKDILISVIMCEYNTKETYLRESIESVLNQTYHLFEFIIVNDGSGKLSKSICKEYADNDSRIKIINQENKGLAAARNAGIRVSKGKYIALMDTDDICSPLRLERQLDFMEANKDVVAAGTWFQFIGNKNHIVKRNIDDHEYYKCCLLFGNVPVIINPSTIIRKKILDEYHIQYDERLKYAEDYEMWYQLSKVGTITNIKEVLLYYRSHVNQASVIYDKNNTKTYFGNLVKSKIIEDLKLNLSTEDMDLFFNFYHSKRWNAIRYITILHKLLSANLTLGIYNQYKLEKRVHEQWISAVQHVKNPFKVICLFISQKGHRKELFHIKFKQLV